MANTKVQSSSANQFRFFKQPGSRYYSVRLMVGGKRRRFSTGETSLKIAQSKAAAIVADIKSQGFEVATKLHSKRRDEIPVEPTIEEFCSIYRQSILTMDSPPTKITSERYARCLIRVCTGAGVRRISGLDAAAVERFKVKYLKASFPMATGPASTGMRKKVVGAAQEKGRETKWGRVRTEAGVRTTLNGILRNAAAIFSQSLLASYQMKGLKLGNPFAGTKLKRVPIKAHQPFARELIDRIWQSAEKLKYGDPDAPAPAADAGYREDAAIDFRKPHLRAYILLLLELGLGLRRNEADKAEWSWAIQMQDDRRFFRVQESEGFMPKSKQSRVIPIDPVIWDSLVATKCDDRYIVPAPERKAKKRGGSTSAVYRCENAHRVLVAWLRKMGVTDPKPCHALRKEFGSYVATQFSLFHAQKLLGHSSPVVTSAYYASLTELPKITPSQMGTARI